jgi:hypothetical protein
LGKKREKMDLIQYLKPEMMVLIPILCFLRNALKGQGCKRRADVFYVLFALILSTGYVLTTSEIDGCGAFWKAVWLGVGQGFACLAACSVTCGRKKAWHRMDREFLFTIRQAAGKNARKKNLRPKFSGLRNKKPRYPRGW